MITCGNSYSTLWHVKAGRIRTRRIAGDMNCDLREEPFVACDSLERIPQEIGISEIGRSASTSEVNLLIPRAPH